MKKYSTLLLGSTFLFLFLIITIVYAGDLAGMDLTSDQDADSVAWLQGPVVDSAPYELQDNQKYLPVVVNQVEDALPNYSNYGDPDHPPIKHATDTFEVSFAVTGDPQFWDMFDQYILDPYCHNEPTDRLLASQKTVKEIHEACKNADPGCMGVFVAGDLTQTSSVQPLIAFRQLYEYGYPGEDGGSIACRDDDDYHRYNWGYNVGYPMFALIGNHDDPTEDGHTEHVQEYLDDLVRGDDLYEFPVEKRFSRTMPSSYFKGNYAWEWGSFNFISLGLWAFYDGYEPGTRTSVDQDKIAWLKEYLASVGHERAIILFQHFGWDGFSFHHNDDGTYQWWSRENAELLVNVLCNRESSDEPCGTEAKPRYNVIGIFSGHTHEVVHKTICAEKDVNGNCVVAFDNYIVNDAGPISNNDGTGYTMVHLNVWPEGYPRHTDVQMTVTNRNLTDFDYAYDNVEPADGDNNTTYDLVTHSTHTRTGISTGFTTWDQGEPNGGRHENCASFKANGRFNDSDCTDKLRFICREIDPQNPSISELHLLTAEDAGDWEHGEFVCEDSGEHRSFSLPKSLEEQLDLMQMIIDSGDSSPVWVNKSDQIEEGHWITFPQDYFYFEPGQPDDGAQLPKTIGHGEDCAVINEDGLLEDRRCENELHNYVCKDHNRWFIHSEKGMWKQGFDDSNCGEHGFSFPANVHEFSKMVDDLTDDLTEYGIAWISLNDITEEGNWVNTTWMQKCWGEDEDGEATLPSDTSRQNSTGNKFSCGIRQDGTVKCWGYNGDGQLDAPEGVFLQISSGERHACGVRNDKTVVCWGWNGFGQLDAPAGKFHQVSAGNIHSCGVRIDRTLSCWGDNGRNQLDAPTSKFRQISAGYYHTCGMDENHAVQCWGDNSYDQSNAPSDAFRQVSAGQWHTCGILMNSNEVTCWGDNSQGQLDVPSGSFLKIDAGYWHSCGLLGTLPHSQFEGHWKLDEGSGTIVTDSSPNGYDGRLVNSPTWSRDIPKTYFDNSHSLKFKRAEGDAVLIPGTINIDNLSEFTISTWVKLTGMPDDTIMRFVTLGNGKAYLRYDGLINGGGPGQLHFYMIDENGTLHHVRKNGALSSGHWLHIAGTYDGSTMRLYLNGVEQGSTEVSGQVKTGNGVRLSDSGGEGLDGRLDEVRIYNRALVPTEIQALAARNQASSGTLACWGNNANGQLAEPSGTFDQVSAGGFHSCSIKSFVHPWEDDFADGQKHNDAEDCAELYTFIEDGKQTAKFRDRSCSHYGGHNACKSVETGEWKITEQSGSKWAGGFDSCVEEFGEYGNYKWRFDAPISEADNDKLIKAIWEQLGENKSVWLNYSDARAEGLWRHAYWENWQDGMPMTGFGNCAALYLYDGTFVQRDCYDIKPYIVCDRGYESDQRYFFGGLGNWEGANSVCSRLVGEAFVAFPQSYEEAMDIYQFVPSYVSYVWIRFTDLDHEGQWEDWVYGD